MSREMKFRVWDKLLKQWGNPKDFLFIDAKGNLRLGDSENCSIIQQFTGIKDSQGKEIYEGDIVKDAHGTYAVDWTKWVGMIMFERFEDGNVFDLSQFDAEDCEILGNLFETPELLK